MQVVRVGPLDTEEAERVLIEPAQSQNVKLPDADVKHVVSQTGGHIHLLILAGNLLWNLRKRLEEAGKLKRAQPLNDAQYAILDAQLQSIFMDPFEMYWRYLQPEERKALRILSKVKRNQSAGQFIEQLQEESSSMGSSARQIWPFLALLEEKGLVRSDDQATSYEIFPPLFSSWVDEFANKIIVDDETDDTRVGNLPTSGQLQLTGFESKLYEYLSRYLDRVCTFSELSLAVWEDAALAADEQEARKKLQVLISRLRPKISQAKLDVVNVRDQGYRLLQEDGSHLAGAQA
jgi:DNA-binding winged helix-turn-helix (wHTH) protein